MRVACGYCGTENDSDVARCQLCGRRLGNASSLKLVPETFGNTAAKLDPRPVPEEVEERKRGPIQGRLFPVQEPKKVIPFERISPDATLAGRKAIERNAKIKAQERFSERMGLASGLPKNAKENQQRFAFPAEEKEMRKAEPVRYTNAPVATPAHRAMAAAYDMAMVLIGFGLFTAVHYFGGAGFGWSAWDKWGYAALGLILSLFYFCLFAFANGDTPGMRAVRLRLLNLDGRAPSRNQRFLRILGALISIVSLGIGLLWCLFDEEQLTWHDEISGTFPSPVLE